MWPHFLQSYGFSPICFFSWAFLSKAARNVFLQNWQINGFSLVCFLSRFFLSFGFKKTLSQNLHANFPLCSWISATCLVKSAFLANVLVHISQQKFFSFSCTNLTCSASFCTPLKLATHLAQLCVFPPICSWMASKCLVRCSFHENDLLHLSQQKSLIFSCTNFKCFSNPFFLENALVQISQTYCFTFLWKILCVLPSYSFLETNPTLITSIWLFTRMCSLMFNFGRLLVKLLVVKPTCKVPTLFLQITYMTFQATICFKCLLAKFAKNFSFALLILSIIRLWLGPSWPKSFFIILLVGSK